jgi:hypothetical protein
VTGKVSSLVLKPKESVSTVVNALALQGPEWPQGGYRIEFTFCLGDKAKTMSFYYMSRHHDALRDAAKKPPAAETKTHALPADAKEAADPAPLTLVVKGPFADSKQVPFKKTDCTFVQPLDVELRDGNESCTLVRVRFRFVGQKDLGSGLRVAISQVDDFICADRRFLSRIPLWAGTKDDEFIGMAEFVLMPENPYPPFRKRNLDQLQVTFSRVRLFEDAAQPLTEAAWTQAIALIAKLDDENFDRRDAVGRELAALGKPFLPYVEMLDQALAEHPKAPPNLRVKLGKIETAIYRQKPDRVLEALKRRISVEFVKTPLSKAMESVSSMSGVVVVLDPEVKSCFGAKSGNKEPVVGNFPIDLRVNDTDVDLVLGSICQVTYGVDPQMEYVLRRNCVLITTSAKARMLRKLARPGSPGSSYEPRFPPRRSL